MDVSTNRPIAFPALEFHAAGWAFQIWGQRCLDPEINETRMEALKTKLRAVQTAVTKSTGSSGRSRPTAEIVWHEYEFTKRKLDELLPKLANDSKGLSIERCPYTMVELSITTHRPFFFVLEDQQPIASSTDTSGPSSHDLALVSVAEVFGIERDAVAKKVTKGRKENRFHEPPTETHQFLVYAFLVQAREAPSHQSEQEMLMILESLFVSR